MKWRLVRRVRQNHAIEHGTIAVLLGRGKPTPLGGYSTARGFFIYGDVSTDDVVSAANQALERMRSGEKDLAVSPYCGTNMAVGALLSAAVVGLVMGRSRRRLGGLPMLALGIGGSLWLRRPLGEAVQRRFTTLSEVAGVSIDGVRRIQLGRHTIHVVRTSRDAEEA